MAPEHAFDRLYSRYARDVYRFAYGLVRNRADAEDVAQTAFLNAYRALERGDRPESPRNWLFAIAQNVYRQHLRRSQRRVPEVQLDVELAEAIAVEENTSFDPSEITRALDQLSSNQRAALVMRELEGRSYAEIATALGLSMSAVETLIFRARRALREQLESSLTCADAEQLIQDGLGSKALRAHLRECAACRTVARSTRARRSALRSLFGLPWLGGGTTAVATKVAAVVVATGIAGGLTDLLAPAAKPHAASPPMRMPIAAVIAVPRAQHASYRPALVRKREPRVTTVQAAPHVAVGAPIHTPARPDASTVAVAPAAPPEAPAATTTSTPAAAPVAPQPDAAPATTTTAAAATTTAATTTVEVQTPVVTVSVTLPSPPPVELPDLTQTSQNSGARNPLLGHLHP